MRRGFTLIEVLVVLGITILLIGIVIPSLFGARQRGQQVQCGNHLKQIMAGVISYATESRQAMMFSNSATVEEETNPDKPKWRTAGWLYNWHDSSRFVAFPASRPKPFNGFRGDDIKEGLLWHYVNPSRKIYFCPSTNMSKEDELGNAEVLTSYLMNAAVTGLGSKVLPFRIDRFEAKHVSFWEPQGTNEGNKGDWNDGNIEPKNWRTARHIKGVNVACFDGHVEFWTNLNFDREAFPPDGVEPSNPSTYTPPYATRLWCDPRDPAKGFVPNP